MIKVLLQDLTGIDVPPEGSKLSSALNIFHAIRRVSYVLLDINSSPLFLRVDSHNLLRNIEEKPDMLLYDEDSAINRTLDEMERLLFTEMYANEEVSEFKFHYIEGQKSKFKHNIKRQSLQYYCSSSANFATRLYDAKYHNLGKFTVDSSVKKIIRLTLLPLFPFERSDCVYYQEQKNLLEFSDWCSVYNSLAQYLVECHKFEVDEQLIGYSLSLPLQQLLLSILNRFIDSSLTVRFSAGTSPVDYPASVITKSNLRKWFKNVKENLIETNISNSRIFEFKALLRLIQRKREDLCLVAMSNIRLHDSEGSVKVEWDGAFVNIQPNNLVLYLVEAKSGHSKRSSVPKNQLLDSIEKAGIKAETHQLIPIPCKGYAYIAINLKNIELK